MTGKPLKFGFSDNFDTRVVQVSRREASCWLVSFRCSDVLREGYVMNIFSFSVSVESVAGIPASRKFGLIALMVALAALMPTPSALAARRHHAASQGGDPRVERGRSTPGAGAGARSR